MKVLFLGKNSFQNSVAYGMLAGLSRKAIVTSL